MTDMHTKLKGHIAAVIEGLRHLDVDSAAALIALFAAEEATGDRSDDAFADAVLDGLRWGHHAAVVVEMGGGALLRVVEPGGVAITSEWARAEDARPQIKAALAALDAEQSICAGVGSHYCAACYARIPQEAPLSDDLNEMRAALLMITHKANEAAIYRDDDDVLATIIEIANAALGPQQKG